jgi:aspartyl-tRNA(Asn)/glutamyl-tRNA(Gln) amidotransferase subunit C
MSLSIEEVKHIAQLARIGLSDEEGELFRYDLSTVLDWFGELQAVDTDGVDPIGHIAGQVNVMDSDTIREAPPTEKKGILENFPRKRGTALEVKSVF